MNQSVEKIELSLRPEEFHRDYPTDSQALQLLQPIEVKNQTAVDAAANPILSFLERQQGKLVRTQDILASEILSEINYLFQTGEGELDTERCNYINNILRKLFRDTNKKIRVIILKRGLEPKVTSFADGTVCVTQSALNRVHSEDELAAVLAPEVAKLQRQSALTAEIASDISALHGYALGRAHEAVAAKESLEILEQAGYNTRAIETVAKELHSAVLSAAVHHLRDSATSHLSLKDLSKPLHTTSIKPTNAELIGSLVYASDDEATRKQGEQLTVLSNILGSLHGRDLFYVINRIQRNFDSYNYFVWIKLRTALVAEISRRIADAGYSQDERVIFEMSLSLNFSRNMEFPTHLFSSLEEVGTFIDALEELENRNVLLQMYQNIFGYAVQNRVDCPDVFSAFITDFSKKNILELSPELFFKLLTLHKKIMVNNTWNSEFKKMTFFMYWFNLTSGNIFNTATTHIHQFREKCSIWMMRIADVAWVNQVFVREEAIKFFTTAKELHIFPPEMIRNQIVDLYEESAPGSNEAQLYEVIAEVFGLSLKKEVSSIPTIQELIDRYLVSSFGNSNSEEYCSAEPIEILLRYLEQHKYMSEVTLQETVQLLFRYVDSLDVKTTNDPLVFLAKSPAESLSRNPNGNIEASDEFNSLFLKALIKVNILSKMLPSLDAQSLPLLQEAISGISPFIEQLSLEQQIRFFVYLNKGSGAHWSVSQFAMNTIQQHWVANNSGTSSSFTLPADQFHHMPMATAVAEKLQMLPKAMSIAELVQQLKVFYSLFKDPFYNLTKGDDEGRFSDIFSQEPWLVVLGERYRENLLELLNVTSTKLSVIEIHEIVLRFLPKNTFETVAILRRINLKYIANTAIPFKRRVIVLLDNFADIGAEGLIVIGKTIHDFSDYQYLYAAMHEQIDKLLESPNDATLGFIALELANHFFSGKQLEVLQTSDDTDDGSKQASTKLAALWSQFNITAERSGVGRELSATFIPEQGKFAARKTSLFISFSDLISLLKGMSETARFFLATKALTERHGVLANKNARTQLFDVIKKAVGLENEFVELLMKAAITNGNTKLVALSASRLISPLLFQGLAVARVDVAELLQNPKIANKIADKAQLKRILAASTDQIRVTSHNYSTSPHAWISQKAERSDQVFREIYSILNSRLETLPPVNGKNVAEQAGNDVTLEQQTKISHALETVISAVEWSSPVGVKCLQLARQMYSFSPEVEARLDNSLDRNPGIEKIFALENLRKWLDSDPKLSAFFRSRKVSIGEYLGGGSLFTTFELTLASRFGRKTSAVIKFLNPNAESIVTESYLALKKVVEELKNSEDTKWQHEISIVELLLGTAHAWCMAEITDATFERDDELYAPFVRKLTSGTFDFSVPKVLFNSKKVKIETRATGQTMNAYFADASTPYADKKHVAQELMRLFVSQIQEQQSSTLDGRNVQLLHSDPHLGNYMINPHPIRNWKHLFSSPKPVAAVLDRHMYLKLTPEECSIAQLLLQGETMQFFHSLLAAILRRNAIPENSIEAMIINIGQAVLMEVPNALNMTSTEDKAHLLPIIMAKLPEGVTPPLEILLLVRNVVSLQRLLKKYAD